MPLRPALPLVASSLVALTLVAAPAAGAQATVPDDTALVGRWRVFVRPAEVWRHLDLEPDGRYRLWTSDERVVTSGHVLERGRWRVTGDGAATLCLSPAGPVGRLVPECGAVTVRAEEGGARRLTWEPSDPRYPGYAYAGVALRPALVLDERSGRITSDAEGATEARFAFEVEQPVRLARRYGPPVFPPELAAAGISGEALLRFIVDTAGRVEPGTTVPLRATHPEFADAGRRAVSLWQFTPALRDGRTVRQVVELPLRFDAPRPKADPEASKRRPFMPQEVDRGIRHIPGSGYPVYPRRLLDDHVEADVAVQFVVDTLGWVEEWSIRPVAAGTRKPPAPEFVESVRSWLLRERFYPAEKDGRKVRQLAVQTFQFYIRR